MEFSRCRPGSVDVTMRVEADARKNLRNCVRLVHGSVINDVNTPAAEVYRCCVSVLLFNLRGRTRAAVLRIRTGMLRRYAFSDVLAHMLILI